MHPAVLGPVSEPIPLWRALLWVAIISSVLAVAYLIWLERRKPRFMNAKALAVILLTAVSWGGFRLASDHRWRVNGLTNDAIALFELTEDGDVYKGVLHHESRCGLHDVNQYARLSGVEKPSAGSGGRGDLSAATFALAEATATQLERDGWAVTRLENTGPDDGEVATLSIHAEHESGYTQIHFSESQLRIYTYTARCLADYFHFYTLSAESEQVDSFSL